MMVCEYYSPQCVHVCDYRHAQTHTRNYYIAHLFERHASAHLPVLDMSGQAYVFQDTHMYTHAIFQKHI